jgi:hypothetical protein
MIEIGSDFIKTGYTIGSGKNDNLNDEAINTKDKYCVDDLENCIKNGYSNIVNVKEKMFKSQINTLKSRAVDMVLNDDGTYEEIDGLSVEEGKLCKEFAKELTDKLSIAEQIYLKNHPEEMEKMIKENMKNYGDLK